MKLAKWSDFEGALQDLDRERQERARRSGRSLHDPLFRGLGNSEWGLDTTLERSYPSERCDETASLRKYYRKMTVSKPAIETFSGMRWDKLPTFPEFEKRIADDAFGWLDMLLSQIPEFYEYLAYLRHHGFPSPLLDWTASPYVAAFFAFDSPPKDADRVCVCAFLQDTVHGGSSDSHLFIVGPYIRSHPRHLVQQCRYSMCVTKDFENHDYLFCAHQAGLEEAAGPEGELFRITIPIEERLTVLKRLELMNINAFSLFGSDDSLIHTVARRELLFRDWN